MWLGRRPIYDQNIRATRPHADEKRENASERARGAVDEDGEQHEHEDVVAGDVEDGQIDHSHDVVEHEGDQNHHDDQLHAHDFLRVGNAPHAPDHQTHKIGETGHRVEGKAAILRRREMAEGVLHRHATLHHQRGNVRLTAARYTANQRETYTEVRT